jgi:hypothetical protein
VSATAQVGMGSGGFAAVVQGFPPFVQLHTVDEVGPNPE